MLGSPTSSQKPQGAHRHTVAEVRFVERTGNESTSLRIGLLRGGEGRRLLSESESIDRSSCSPHFSRDIFERDERCELIRGQNCVDSHACATGVPQDIDPQDGRLRAMYSREGRQFIPQQDFLDSRTWKVNEGSRQRSGDDVSSAKCQAVLPSESAGCLPETFESADVEALVRERWEVRRRLAAVERLALANGQELGIVEEQLAMAEAALLTFHADAASAAMMLGRAMVRQAETAMVT
jgi:hypothetical protein